jgi:N-acyl-phosphatidylethanolamine-hydrolysing phospholipase D
MWINHSTFLIKVENVHILTDPIWSQRCSPVSFFGPKRRHPPALALKTLPKIDYVLISHNHYDHLDKKTVLELFALYPDITWLVPLGVQSWFTKLGISKVFEHTWWESRELSNPASSLKISITAVPAQHFSGRNTKDINSTLWVGWVVEFKKDNSHSKRFYFVGDTGYNPYDFKKIGEHWQEMDLSLIPIGSYVPRKFMSPVHIEPFDAVRIHQEVKSKLSIGMHWKTFRLSDEPLNQPPYDLYLALQKEGIDPSHFLALEPGHEINW